MLDTVLSQSEFTAPSRDGEASLARSRKRAFPRLNVATLLRACLGGSFAAATVRVAALFGLLVFPVQSASAADPKCMASPTVECVAEIAAQSARRLDRGTRWEEILGKLAVAGRTDVAEELSSRLPNVSWPSKAWLQEKIIALRIAAAARANASSAGTLDALSALDGDPQRISTTLYYAFLDLAGEQPYTRGGTPWLVDAEKAYASRHRAACNATSQAVLQRWGDTVNAVPAAFRTSALLDLGNAYSICHDNEAALRALDKIDPSQLARKNDSLNLTLLVRSLIRAGSLDRALAVATVQPDPKSEVKSYLEIARAYVLEGRNSNALSIAKDASLALAKVKHGAEEVELRAGLINVERQAGDSAGALTQTEKLALLAERPDPFLTCPVLSDQF